MILSFSAFDFGLPAAVSHISHKPTAPEIQFQLMNYSHFSDYHCKSALFLIVTSNCEHKSSEDSEIWYKSLRKMCP